MLRHLPPDTRELVVDLLAEAFADDPGYAYAAGGAGASHRSQRRALFSAEVGTVLSAAGPAALLRASRAEARTSSLRPNEPHHTLASLAVAPEEQGRGLARAVLDHVHEQCSLDERSIGVFLETSEPSNVPFYERLGYRVTERVALGPIRIWGMLRPALARHT